jgi:hypothetical protein
VIEGRRDRASHDPIPDRTLVLYDLLDRIAELQAQQAHPSEIELLAIEYRLLRAEL